MAIYEKIFKTQIKNRKLNYALDMSKYNPKYHEEAEKLAISTINLDYYSIF
ncbi:hypothetical protein LCGC14_0837420 [marine sediment metagenome]|uniref:Uncharacterized protein n=1 Tax=marine sediment metagenome TaxID=412755 RepID=A0A0F9PE39_9ZZZZ